MRDMTEMTGLSDEELWRLTRDGDDEAETALIERYVRLVKVCARPLFLAGGDGEDLIQEGMFGLMSAVRRFSPEKDASFRTFAERCVRNRLYTAVRSAARSKHFPLNYSVSFDSSDLSDLSGGAADYLRDPEDLIISRERVGEILAAAKNTLSGFEARVLELYLNGCSYNEIAEQVGKTPKSVDNAVQRIRKKLTAYY